MEGRHRANVSKAWLSAVRRGFIGCCAQESQNVHWYTGSDINIFASRVARCTTNVFTSSYSICRHGVREVNYLVNWWRSNVNDYLSASTLFKSCLSRHFPLYQHQLSKYERLNRARMNFHVKPFETALSRRIASQECGLVPTWYHFQRCRTSAREPAMQVMPKLQFLICLPFVVQSIPA